MSPLKIHLQRLPIDLVQSLELEFQKLHQEYFLGHWEPSQLDGGRFAEAVFRILEYKDKGNFTQVGTQLKILKIIPSVENSTSLPESLRFHVLKLAELIFDFRSSNHKRQPKLKVLCSLGADNFFPFFYTRKIIIPKTIIAIPLQNLIFPISCLCHS